MESLEQANLVNTCKHDSVHWVEGGDGRRSCTSSIAAVVVVVAIINNIDDNDRRELDARFEPSMINMSGYVHIYIYLRKLYFVIYRHIFAYIYV